MSLPKPGTPLQLPNGQQVYANKPYVRVEVPSNTAAQRLVASTQRKLIDLPGVPKQMNAVAAVLVYTASGLSDDEISIALRTDATQVAALRQTEIYKQFETSIIAAVEEASASDVTAILAKGEVDAADTVVKLLKDEDSKVALAAAKDVLDRRGHRKPDKLDINLVNEQTFRIEVVDKRDSNVPNVIDVEAS
jgi:hypothetical protein